MESQLDVIFGSTSDEEKVIPGVIEFTQINPEMTVRVHYASADNTPEKVDTIMRWLRGGTGPKSYQSGAGMSNVLTGVVKTYSTLDDIVIGIPIFDKNSGGLSSFASTSDKPPMNPVLVVGLNDSYAALNIANRFNQYNFCGVVLCKGRGSSEEALGKVAKSLDEIGLHYITKDISKVEENEVVITPFYDKEEDLVNVDEILKGGLGIQIGVCSRENEGIEGYMHFVSNTLAALNRTEATGVVGIAGYANAAQMAAQIMQYQPSLEAIKAKKGPKVETLNEHQGLYVARGVVRRSGE